ARFTSGGTSANTSGYCLFIRSDGAPSGAPTTGKLQISKKPLGGSLGTLGSTPTTGVPLFAIGGWYKVTLKVTGTSPVTLTGSINDVQLAVVQDAADVFTSGGPAVITRGAQASFDDV